MTRPADTADDRRWRAAIHESAHVAATFALGGKPYGAWIDADGCGSASCGGCLRGTLHAIMCAAGPASAPLADQTAPPETPAAAPAIVDEIPLAPPLSDEEMMSMHEELQFLTTDERTVAEWAITKFESEPEKWAGRVAWVRYQGWAIVRENAGLILAIARRLFLAGRVTSRELYRLVPQPALEASVATAACAAQSEEIENG